MIAAISMKITLLISALSMMRLKECTVILTVDVPE